LNHDYTEEDELEVFFSSYSSSSVSSWFKKRELAVLPPEGRGTSMILCFYPIHQDFPATD
jgi:hypothetical protein